MSTTDNINESGLNLNGQYGAYGIISEGDLSSKMEEFTAWAIEVKGANRGMLSQKEERNLFKDFMEDYNTATMPHVKYYDMAKWRREGGGRDEGVTGGLDGGMIGMSDEEKLRIERQRAREAEAKAREEEKVMRIRMQLEQAKESHSSAYYDALDRQMKNLQPATFESIAKEREEAKKRKEIEARRKYK